MLNDRLYDIAQWLRPRIPFTSLNTVSHCIDREAKSILDVGCGKGEPMRYIGKRMRLVRIGIDIFRPYLVGCLRMGTHTAVVQGDVRRLPFQAKSFDVVLGMEVLEHLHQADGTQLLEEMERVARRQVILTTPIGPHEQHEYDGNPYQQHRHIWSPRALEALGYVLIGHGIRGIGSWAGVQSPLPALLRPLVNVAWVIAGPIVRYAPAIAGDVVAIKRLPTSGCHNARHDALLTG